MNKSRYWIFLSFSVKINSMERKYALARMLRKNTTKEERILWQLLRNRQFFGLKFRRQYPIGKYIVDFVCESKKVVIELDGGQHNEPENILLDEERTKFIENQGYKVIRFWNSDINKNISGVYDKLLEIIDY